MITPCNTVTCLLCLHVFSAGHWVSLVNTVHKDIPTSIILGPVLRFQTLLVTKVTACGEITVTKCKVSKTSGKLTILRLPLQCTWIRGKKRKEDPPPPHSSSLSVLTVKIWPCYQGHRAQDLAGWLSRGDACSTSSSPKAPTRPSGEANSGKLTGLTALRGKAPTRKSKQQKQNTELLPEASCDKMEAPL